MIDKIDKEPYFMSNKEWYEILIDKENFEVEIVMTDKAPLDAIKDYNKNYKNNL